MQSRLTKAVLSNKNLLLRYFSTISEISKDKTIGFIGLGNMGAHMATNLLKHGHSLVVYDVYKPSVENIKKAGVEHNVKVVEKSTPKDVASEVDVLITMLPSSPHVKEVYTGENGVSAAFETREKQNKPQLVALDCSTISPPVAKEVADIINSKYAKMIDAPVSGGVTGASAGTLTFMVGGEKSVYDLTRPLLERMGKNIVYCGVSGTGQTAKVCNNLILAISMAGVAEAYNLGIQSGIDPNVLANIVNTSSGRCWASDSYNPVPGIMENTPSSKEYNVGFAVDLMLKDVRLAKDAAEHVHAPFYFGDLAAKTYQDISETGKGKKDFGYIYQYYKQNTTKK